MCKSSRNSNGFSLVELLIVCGIAMVVLALLIPNMVQTLAAISLRGNMSDIAGLYQSARARGIRRNSIQKMTHETVQNRCVLYADDTVSPTGLSPTLPTPKPPQIWLPTQISCYVGVPTGGSGQPTAMDATNFCAGTFTPPATLEDDPTHETSFNQTGLPCLYDSGTCTNKAFAYYFTYTASLGQTKWAALAVSPAGRIRACYWNGSAWAN